jgi:glycosyltransferase involved in cell wall biosynthesis
MTTIENFPPLELFMDSRKSFDRDDFVIGYAGGLSKERGIRELAQATQIFSVESKTRPRLLLIGDFRSREEKDDLLRSFNRQDFDLQITGWIPHESVPRLLAGADVCVLPLQRSERTIRCMPVKLYEYMALSKPVVAPDFGQTRKLVQKTDCGMLVDSSNPKALAAAIAHYFTNPEEISRQGASGRAWVEEQFNWGVCEQRLVSLYRHLFTHGHHCKQHSNKDYLSLSRK